MTIRAKYLAGQTIYERVESFTTHTCRLRTLPNGDTLLTRTFHDHLNHRHDVKRSTWRSRKLAVCFVAGLLGLPA